MADLICSAVSSSPGTAIIFSLFLFVQQTIVQQAVHPIQHDKLTLQINGSITFHHAHPYIVVLVPHTFIQININWSTDTTVIPDLDANFEPLVIFLYNKQHIIQLYQFMIKK